MATIDDRKHVDEIIAANGQQYPEEPPVVRIVQYDNAWGGVSYGLVWQDEPQDMQYRYNIETEFVRNPRTIWERK